MRTWRLLCAVSALVLPWLPCEAASRELLQATSAVGWGSARWNIGSVYHGAQAPSASQAVNWPAAVARPTSTAPEPLQCTNESSSIKWRELPKVSGGQRTCNRQRRYQEWSEMAIVLLEVPQQSGAAALARVNAAQREVLVHVTTAAAHKAWQPSLRGENHFLVWTKYHVGTARSLNRLIRMANTDVVLVMLPGTEQLLSEQLWLDVLSSFRRHPKLGMLSLHSGFVNGVLRGPGGPVQTDYDTTGVLFVDIALFGPVAIRRSAFHQVGQLSVHTCPDECANTALHDLSRRMWQQQFQVGVLKGPQVAADVRGEPCGVPSPTPQYVFDAMRRAQSDAGAAEGSALPPLDRPLAAFIMQYFRRRPNIKPIMDGLRMVQTTDGTEILINNDSGSEVSEWMAALSGTNEYMVIMNDLHEIRGYNRLAKMASARFLVFLQDDDAPQKRDWLANAVKLFMAHPKLALLGGFRGRMDYGSNKRSSQVDGPKFGTRATYIPSVRCCLPVTHTDPTTRIPFMFMYKVNMAPMMVRRREFHSMGMFLTELSCPGAPGIGFDFEYSVRCWANGLQVGLYDAGFKFDIGDHSNSGTRANKKVYAERRANEHHNNALLYRMYKGLHHRKGTLMANDLNRMLKPNNPIVPWTDSVADQLVKGTLDPAKVGGKKPSAAVARALGKPLRPVVAHRSPGRPAPRRSSSAQSGARSNVRTGANKQLAKVPFSRARVAPSPSRPKSSGGTVVSTSARLLTNGKRPLTPSRYQVVRGGSSPVGNRGQWYYTSTSPRTTTSTAEQRVHAASMAKGAHVAAGLNRARVQAAQRVQYLQRAGYQRG